MRSTTVSATTPDLKTTAKREAALLLGFLLFGLLILPIAIYLVGLGIFGEYGGGGFGDFYAGIHRDIRSGDRVVWFLVFAPYLIWQVLRLTIGVFRYVARLP